MGRPFRTLFQVGTVGELTDGQLLERFATAEGEAAELAFAVLVERHGPMVLRVCRGVLRDEHEVQDAFQAAFLVLVRKGRSLWVRDSLGPWLHAVAYRAACRARGDQLRRQAHERRAAAMATTTTSPSVPDDRGDVEAVLHAEMDRLPSAYRAAVVLCDLEGRTHEQAARILRCPVGTIKSRLARGRSRLRERLTRRGLAPGALVGIGTGSVATGSQTAVPETLVRATIEVAVRGAAGEVVPAAVAGLAEGVLRAMIAAKLSTWTVTMLGMLGMMALAGAGAVLAGGGRLGPAAAPGPIPTPRDDPPPALSQDEPDPPGGPAVIDGEEVYRIDRGPMDPEVLGLGQLVSPSAVDLTNQVEGETTVLFLLPEGTRVKQGQLVAELDSARLRDRLVDQEIAVEKAESEFMQARGTLQIAEIAVREYVEGLFPIEELALEGELALARSELTLAEEELARLANEGDPRAAGRAKLDGQRAQFTLRTAEMRLHVLKEFTRHRRIRQLQSDVEKATADMLARQAVSELEKAKAEKLRRQIEACKVYAPIDGVVYYSTSLQGDRWLEPGAAVRERQLLLRVVRLGDPMMVNTEVPEAIVSQIKVGRKAQVKFIELPFRDMAGEVKSISPTPVSRYGVNFYTAHVEIENPLPELRPGMGANVEFAADDPEPVLRVPVRALASSPEGPRVAVRMPDGRYTWRKVALGPGHSKDRQFAQVREGLQPGDVVSLDPARHDPDRPPDAPADPPTDAVRP